MSAALDTAAHAEQLTTEIGRQLDTMADAHESVLPLIREAVESEAWRTLGYNGVSAWAEDRFQGALTRLGVDTRREVVREMTAAGMSTRAIAPVLGVNQSQVARDRQVMQPASPEPAWGSATEALAKITETHSVKTETHVDVETGEVKPAPPAPAKVIGLDGKVYSRPEPKPAPTAEEFLASEPSVQRARYIASFHKAIGTVGRLTEFQPADVAQLTVEEWDSIDLLIDTITRWRDAINAARAPRHLRSI